MNVVWKKQRFEKDIDFYYSKTAKVFEHEIYIRGTCSSKNSENPRTFCHYLSVFDNEGNELFFKRWYFGKEIVIGPSVFVDDYIFSTGEVYESSDKMDIYFSLMTLSGEPVFEYIWGSEGRDSAYSIAIDGNEIFVAGVTNGDLDGNENLTGETPNWDKNKNDFFMTKFVLKSK
jgi:hypothetical protein